MNVARLLWVLALGSAIGCVPPKPAPSAAANPIVERTPGVRLLGERKDSGAGYRQDEGGIAVVHLRGSEAEMDAQYRALLGEEVAGFQQAAGSHREMRPYLGGCSNFAVFGAATPDGTLWHGRNFDFSGHGVLDRFRVVYIVEPQEAIPYVALSWTGPSPWNYRYVQTAMNARGLSLGYMITASSDETVNDVPALWTLYRRVLEQAGTMDEALSILRAGPRPGPANLLLADGNEPSAVVVEMTSSTMVVREAQDGVIYSTNHFVSDELFDPENKDPDSLARYGRLASLMAENAGAFDLTASIAALRDRHDVHTQRLSPDGDVIGSPLNMLSVVFHPGDLTFWVANGAAPASYREFIGFSLRDELDGQQALTDLPIIPADPTVDAPTWDEIESYQAARRAYDQRDDKAAVELVSKALAHNPASPRYGYLLGNALMGLGRNDESVAALRQALTGDAQSVYRPYIYYRLGLIYQQRGQSAQMRDAFENVLALDIGDREIEDYARRALLP